MSLHTTKQGKDCSKYLSNGYIVCGSVEDRRVVILILDLDGQCADILQLGPAFVRDLDRHVDQLFSVGLVSIENLKEEKRENEKSISF